MATDEQLIEQIRHGNSEAYGQLFRKYYQQIYSICFVILRNTYDAEEVTQETFVQAYLKLNQLKKPDKFFAWLKKIAQNRCKNYTQQMKTRMISLDLVSAQTDEQFSVQSGIATLPHIAPDEHILKQELVDSIMEAVEALPPKDREVVRAHIDGLNHAEISERFGISVEASMSRLYRARKKLAARVKDLLNAIFGLPKLLPLKKIISGGIVAMKIGTSAKVTIGVIGVLVAGFIGFQIVTHQPDVGPSKVVTQLTSMYANLYNVDGLSMSSLGLLANPIRRFYFGAMLQHIASHLTVGDGKESQVLPRNIKTAAAFNTGKLSVGLGLDNLLSSHYREISAGCEFRTCDYIALRTGWRAGMQREANFSWSAGMGLLLKRMQIDYAYMNQTSLASTHLVSISILTN